MKGRDFDIVNEVLDLRDCELALILNTMSCDSPVLFGTKMTHGYGVRPKGLFRLLPVAHNNFCRTRESPLSWPQPSWSFSGRAGCGSKEMEVRVHSEGRR